MKHSCVKDCYDNDYEEFLQLRGLEICHSQHSRVLKGISTKYKCPYHINLSQASTSDCGLVDPEDPSWCSSHIRMFLHLLFFCVYTHCKLVLHNINTTEIKLKKCILTFDIDTLCNEFIHNFRIYISPLCPVYKKEVEFLMYFFVHMQLTFGIKYLLSGMKNINCRSVLNWKWMLDIIIIFCFQILGWVNTKYLC